MEYVFYFFRFSHFFTYLYHCDSFQNIIPDSVRDDMGCVLYQKSGHSLHVAEKKPTIEVLEVQPSNNWAAGAAARCALAFALSKTQAGAEKRTENPQISAISSKFDGNCKN